MRGAPAPFESEIQSERVCDAVSAAPDSAGHILRRRSPVSNSAICITDAPSAVLAEYDFPLSLSLPLYLWHRHPSARARARKHSSQPNRSAAVAEQRANAVRSFRSLSQSIVSPPTERVASAKALPRLPSAKPVGRILSDPPTPCVLVSLCVGLWLVE